MYLNRTFSAQARSISRLSNGVLRLSALRSQLFPDPVTAATSTHQRRTMATSIPATQNAVLIETTGGPEVLQFKTDYPVPQPSENQILIKNNISGVNYIDTYFRTGLYPSPKPEVLGREAAGTVAALGPGSDASGLKIGDRVIFLGGSSYAQYTAVATKDVVKIPDNVKDEEAIAAFLSGLTVLTLVNETYAVKKGDTVLVHAAAGGAGFLIVQLLKQIGATVIGTAGGPEKVALVKSLGADYIIDYRSEEGQDWVKLVKQYTNDRGVDVVYDSVGKDTWEGSLEVVRRRGFVCWFGNASGPVPPFPIQRLAAKNVTIARPTLFNNIATREEYEYYVNKLFDLLGSGKLKVRIHKIYPLEDVQQAHKDLEGRKTTGKLLLRP